MQLLVFRFCLSSEIDVLTPVPQDNCTCFVKCCHYLSEGANHGGSKFPNTVSHTIAQIILFMMSMMILMR